MQKKQEKKTLITNKTTNKIKKVGKEEIVERLLKAETITIVGHIHPDHDCIGSSLAFQLILKKLNKKSFIVSYDKMTKELKNLPFIENVIFNMTNDKLPKKDVLVVLDSGEMHRIGGISKATGDYNEVIFIDHHKVRDLNGVTMLYNDMEASATGEIIADIFLDYEIKFKKEKNKNLFDKYIATLIYIAIVSDTGSFIYSNTTEKTLLIASKLMHYKVDILKVSRIVKKQYDEIEIKILTSLYKKVVLCEDKRIGYICVGEKVSGINISELNISVSDIVMQMESVIIGFIIRENKKSFRVSLRSRCEKDIRPIAEKFGGGGHKKASGFEVLKENMIKNKMSTEELIKTIYIEIKKVLDN